MNSVTTLMTSYNAEGGVQEWALSSEGDPLATERNLLHPFHLHVYHMQAIDCEHFEAGEFYDVIDSKCTVRFDLRTSPYSGRTILHCTVFVVWDRNFVLEDAIYPISDWLEASMQ
jgi:hypothetical protein